MAKTQQQRIILGLKIRQARQELGWNFDELSRHSGISVSYLNEIEKGKKYPQPANMDKLAAALQVERAFLESPVLTKQFAPIGELLQSNFLNELPLDLFGIDIQQVVEIIARAPDKVNAFISALLEIARNYSLRDENFFLAALRAYQELHLNHFDDIEAEALQFASRHRLPDNGGVSAQTLADILRSEFNYHIQENGLDAYPELQSLRSVFVPRHKRLLLNSRLSERQRAFQLAKELGFAVLQLKDRPYSSTHVRVRSFDEALNNYRAAYFAVAILINRHAFVRDLNVFFSQPAWNPRTLTQLLTKYQVTPAVLFQRFNVLSGDFDLSKIFFLRIIHHLDADEFEIDKELHLNRRHQPHATGLHEHYCRRWLGLSLLRDLQRAPHSGEPQVLAGVQRATFMDSGEEYLCLALAKQGFPTPGRNVSVSLGIVLDEQARRTIRFWDDQAIPRARVNVTCQRCALADCTDRAAPPDIIRKKADRSAMLQTLKSIVES